VFRITLGVILLSTLLFQGLRAQDPFYYHYDTEIGLPSSEVYDVAFDDQGVGWFPTDRGLASYNGYEFKVYTTRDGLTNNTVLDFNKDPQGRIWMMTLDGSISYLDQGKVYAFAGNDSLGGVRNRDGLVQGLVWDRQGRTIFWFNPHSDRAETFYRWDPQYQSLESYSFDCLAKEYPSRSLAFSEILDVGHGWIPQEKVYNLNMVSDSLFMFTKGYSPTVLYWQVAGQNNSLDSLAFPGLVHSYLVDEGGELWVGSSMGLYHFKDYQSHSTPKVYFEKLAISRLKKDQEGNFWISSLSDGLRCIPSFKFQYPPALDQTSLTQTCLSLANTDHYLVVGGMAGQLMVVDTALQVRTLINNPNDFGKYNNPHMSPQGVSFPGLTVFEDAQGDIQTTQYKAISGRHTIILNDSMYSDLGDARVSFKNMLTGEYHRCFIPAQFSRRVISAYPTDSCIWMGSMSGLIQVGLSPDNFSIEKRDYGVSALSERINDLKGDSFGRLFAGTSGNGLVVVDQGHPYVFQEEDGLVSNMINRLWVENETTIWLATNRGLDRVEFEMGDILRIKKINHINSLDGLPNHFIRDIIIWEDKVWLATNSGLIYFEPDRVIQDKLPLPTVRFETIRFGETIYPAHSKPVLDWDKNKLVIDFVAISYAKPNTHPFYRYRLLGSDTTWNYTNNRRIQFPGLPSGEYTFEVTACNRFHEWNPQPTTFQFSIRPHFSRTWWFQGLVLVGFALLLLGGVYLRSRQRRAKEVQLRFLQEAKLKTREAELAALRNQMNPHFVFNTLNAIQNFIFRQDAPNASYYLGRFAKLMRDGLEFSLKPFIPLSEELDFLNTYLELESLRFPNRFDFEIQIDETLNPEQIELPPFLFQPILENAIKHGFKEIDYKGKLIIQITGNSDRDIKVTILDNGSGLPSVPIAKRSPRLYPSRGLQIVQNHMDLVNNNIESASFIFRNRSSCSGTESIFTFSFSA